MSAESVSGRSHVPADEALRTGASAVVHMAGLPLAVGDRTASEELWDAGTRMLVELGSSIRDVTAAVWHAVVKLEKHERGIK